MKICPNCGFERDSNQATLRVSIKLTAKTASYLKRQLLDHLY
jgi:hypothetical protein